MANYNSLTRHQKEAVDMIMRHNAYNQRMGAPANAFGKEKVSDFVVKNWDNAEKVAQKNNWMQSPATAFSSAMTYVDYRTLTWKG